MFVRVYSGSLVAFAPDSSGELDVLGHDGDSLGVDGAQVGVLEQTDQIGFGSFLQCEHCRRLEAEVRLEVLRDFTNEALKFIEVGGETFELFLPGRAAS